MALAEWVTEKLRQSPVRLSLRAKGLITIALPVVFLIHLGMTWGLSSYKQEDRARAAMVHAQALHAASQSLLAHLFDADANMSAFLMTGNFEYLKSYRVLEESAAEILKNLDLPPANRGSEKRRVRGIRRATKDALDKLSALVQFAGTPDASPGKPPGREIAAMKEALTAFRLEVAKLDRPAQGELAAAMGESRRMPRQAIVDLFCALAGLAGIWFFLKAAGREQEQTARNAAQARVSKFMASYEMFKAELIGGDEPDGVAARSGNHNTGTPLFPAEDTVQAAYSSNGNNPGNSGTAKRDSGILQSVLDSMRDGVVVADGDGACLFSNRAAELIFGQDLAATSLNGWVERFGLRRDDTRTAYLTPELPLNQALLGGVVSRADIYLQPEGSPQGVWLASSATPLKDESGRIHGAVGVFSDITERRAAEDALSHAKEDAERANRAKSEFLSRMSHELRTPLNAILGFAQLLQMARLPEHHHDSVEQILKGGRHLLALINEVLDIARIESGRLSLSLERFATLDAIQETVNLIEPQATRQKIQLYIEAGAAWRLHITADRQRFKQVVLNLISNAVKYNREGGSVRVSAESRDTHLLLSVTDTGPGIPAEKLNLLFSPFERLGAEHTGVEGSGIGLALSKRLTEAMSGRIGVVSKRGQGATFWIEFPLGNAPVFEEGDGYREDLKQLSASVSSEAPVVLCIEDNDSNYRLIERTLAQRPEIRLVLGTLGASAVALAEENQPEVILLDMHLPDLEGGEVLRRLKDNPSTAHIPVVVVSADATALQMERMLNSGVTAYLTKPVDIRKLLDVVDQAISEGAQRRTACLEL